jgi:hypothetical protein
MRLMNRARRLLTVALATAAIAAPVAGASAKVSQLMGIWDGVTTVNGVSVPLRYVITAGSSVTRQALFPTGMMLFVGNYEMVGSQLHITWRDWGPRSTSVPPIPLGDSCIVEFHGPDQFECGGVKFWREY